MALPARGAQQGPPGRSLANRRKPGFTAACRAQPRRAEGSRAPRTAPLARSGPRQCQSAPCTPGGATAPAVRAARLANGVLPEAAPLGSPKQAPTPSRSVRDPPAPDRPRPETLTRSLRGGKPRPSSAAAGRRWCGFAAVAGGREHAQALSFCGFSLQETPPGLH